MVMAVLDLAAARPAPPQAPSCSASSAPPWQGGVDVQRGRAAPGWGDAITQLDEMAAGRLACGFGYLSPFAQVGGWV